MSSFRVRLRGRWQMFSSYFVGELLNWGDMNEWMNEWTTGSRDGVSLSIGSPSRDHGVGAPLLGTERKVRFYFIMSPCLLGLRGMRKRRLYKRAFPSIQAPLGDHGEEAPLPRTLNSAILFYVKTLFIGASERQVKECSRNGHLSP
jgi:hypothetical protein